MKANIHEIILLFKVKGEKPQQNRPKSQDKSTSEPETKTDFMGSLNKPGQKTLPTHSGPKIRHNRPGISRKEIKRKEKLMKNPKKRKALQQEMQKSGEESSNNLVSEEPKAKKAKKTKSKKPKTKAEVKDIIEEKKFSNML